MKFIDMLNKRVKRFDVIDMGLTKWSVFVFTLLLAKFWPVLTTLEWYIYAILFVILVARPMYRFLKK